ncbi:MAG: hypothetical protein RMJ54_17670 [Roseiflexaceae bacterium]|nr:hypothetical protein [Roseiflexus sp.]MDW8234605.1 hypothetical protein [Roseiflexaceae bacterium]
MTVTVAYQALPGRAFAADDFQWLLNVQDRPLSAVAVRAFDVRAESHFFRPLVWLLLWSEWRLFGFDASAFHSVSLALHVLNTALIGWLTSRTIWTQSFLAPIIGGTVAALVAALHPAPFEAVVWVSAQSELLAALFLLLTLHFWWSACFSRGLWRPIWHVAAAATLALALLTKESAVVGLPLIMLIEWEASRVAQRRIALMPLVLPVLVTAAYLAFALDVASRNTLVRESGYGFGAQVALNPLRSLGLIAAPLPGVEYGREAWLPLVGAGVALAGKIALVIVWRYGKGAASLLTGMLALIVTLAPTAPFDSAPDSRYLYLPVMVIALMAGRWSSIFTDWVMSVESHSHRRLATVVGGDNERSEPGTRACLRVRRLMVGVCALSVALVLGVLAVNEVRGREARFAAGARPGEELRLFAAAECATGRLDRILVVEPPIAAPHVEAIIRLSCSSNPQTLVIGSGDIERELRPHTLVVVFKGGFPHALIRTSL